MLVLCTWKLHAQSQHYIQKRLTFHVILQELQFIPINTKSNALDTQLKHSDKQPYFCNQDDEK